MDNDLFALLSSMDDTPDIREQYKRMTFGYPGSKYHSLSHILPALPYANGFCEPMGGSGAVLLARNPSQLEVYNDRCSGIVAFYRCLRDPIKKDRLAELIDLSVHSREDFIYCRDTWENVTDDVDRAYRWAYHIHMSFAKLGRAFGRATKGNSQHGQSFRNQLQWFHRAHLRLKNVQVENQDWRITLKDYDSSNMVFYLDPPYINYAKGAYRNEFTISDHIELVERIFKLQGFVALSAYDDKETHDIYGKYPWDDFENLDCEFKYGWVSVS